MAVYQDTLPDIIPTDVFGAEPSTDAGYAREVVELTLASGDTVNVGRLLVIDDVEKTAVFATHQSTQEMMNVHWYDALKSIVKTTSHGYMILNCQQQTISLKDHYEE